MLVWMSLGYSKHLFLVLFICVFGFIEFKYFFSTQHVTCSLCKILTDFCYVLILFLIYMFSNCIRIRNGPESKCVFKKAHRYLIKINYIENHIEIMCVYYKRISFCCCWLLFCFKSIKDDKRCLRRNHIFTKLIVYYFSMIFFVCVLFSHFTIFFKFLLSKLNITSNCDLFHNFA